MAPLAAPVAVAVDAHLVVVVVLAVVVLAVALLALVVLRVLALVVALLALVVVLALLAFAINPTDDHRSNSASVPSAPSRVVVEERPAELRVRAQPSGVELQHLAH
eukprot:10965096-Alexandrium_andersonii.AAC.1